MQTLIIMVKTEEERRSYEIQEGVIVRAFVHDQANLMNRQPCTWDTSRVALCAEIGSLQASEYLALEDVCQDFLLTGMRIVFRSLEQGEFRETVVMARWEERSDERDAAEARARTAAEGGRVPSVVNTVPPPDPTLHSRDDDDPIPLRRISRAPSAPGGVPVPSELTRSEMSHLTIPRPPPVPGATAAAQAAPTTPAPPPFSVVPSGASSALPPSGGFRIPRPHEVE